MIKITIVKNYRNTETLRVLELSEVVRSIQSCEFAKEVRDVRGISLVVDLSRQDDGSVDGAQTMDEVRKAMQIDYFNDAELIRQQAERFASK